MLVILHLIRLVLLLFLVIFLILQFFDLVNYEQVSTSSELRGEAEAAVLALGSVWVSLVLRYVLQEVALVMRSETTLGAAELGLGALC